MCGRTSQTVGAFTAGDRALGVSPQHSFAASSVAFQTTKKNTSNNLSTSSFDNYNLSPGMGAVVIFHRRQQYQQSSGTSNVNANNDNSTSAATGDNDDGASSGAPVLCSDVKIWGLVPQRGTRNKPLAGGMGQHFSNLMFNARSETLYEKQTFLRLCRAKQSCVVAVDGYFEWKQQGDGPTAKGMKKQPYFVHRQQQQQQQQTSQPKPNDKDEKQQTITEPPCLLLAGLWTSVPTGRDEDPVLDTFTILTTDSCHPIEWLHDRMPVCIWDNALATEWLTNPTQELCGKLVADQLQKSKASAAAAATSDGDSESSAVKVEFLQTHVVTKEMSSTKFRSAEAIRAIKLPKLKTVKSFFQSVPLDGHRSLPQQPVGKMKRKTVTTASALTSRIASGSATNNIASSKSPTKRIKPSSPAVSKKGTITSFFAKQNR